jgi:RluA family pseudouridine synthase
MPPVTNIAAYRFAPLENLPALRQQLIASCKTWGLRGTILLSPEGINLFVAGGQCEIDLLLERIREIPGFEDFAGKISESEDQPFNRMLVKIKREIIAFNVPGIEPGKRTSPKLPPRELKRWLDEGRPITLLDTRNDYEVRMGTFKNAITLPIDHFRDFPAAVSRLPGELKEQPIVMFCTGGIRCEKAGPYMESEGFQQILQLDGGILKYFEECGSDHYDGECFVFDRRVGVDGQLLETDRTQCFNCQAPLSVVDQEDVRYAEGESCPHCFETEEERMQRTIAEREAAIVRATTPLPGSLPYDHFRPFNISARHDGKTLLEALLDGMPHYSSHYWQERFAQQLWLDRNRVPVAADRRVRAGECFVHRMPAIEEPDVSNAIRLLHEDEAVVVVDKPAPLPIHPSGRFNRNTLQAILNSVYRPQKLRPVHRLDANTTGVVVFARTQRIASLVQPQFSAGTVEKLYVARVQGHPPQDEFECDAAIADRTTDLGARLIDQHGLSAQTVFRVLHRFADGTSLLEARPITGRTNQIRVHLWHLGWPIVGEQTYLPGRQLGTTQTHSVSDAPLCLHAQRISLIHPLTAERATYEANVPSWANELK